MVLKKGYNKEIDLWTFGVYLYELSNYEPPFTTDQITRARFQAVVMESENNRVWKNPNLSPELKDLIHNLLKFNEKTRIGAKGWQEIKNHTFFKNFDWKLLEEQKMESPLEDIVAKYPSVYKPYKPEPPRTNTQNEQAKI
jgi:serine/threonine protein kinase